MRLRPRVLVVSWSVVLAAACGSGTTGPGGETGESSSDASSSGEVGSSGATPTTGAATTTGANATASTTADASTSTGGGTGSTGDDDTSETTGGPTCEPPLDALPLAMFAQAFAEAICAQKEACGCDVDFACPALFKADLEQVADFAATHGMAYDEACALQTLGAFVTSRGCTTAAEGAIAYPTCEQCRAFRGDIQDGEACPPYEVFVDVLFTQPCAGEEVFCQQEVCEPFAEMPMLMEGDACFGPMGSLGRCEDGTTCDYADSDVCEPLLAEGADCSTTNGLCDSPLFCSTDQVCDPPRDPGAPCATSDDCTSNYCLDGTCTDYVWICAMDELDELFQLPLF